MTLGPLRTSGSTCIFRHRHRSDGEGKREPILASDMDQKSAVRCDSLGRNEAIGSEREKRIDRIKHAVKSEGGQGDSNPRPPDPQSAAQSSEPSLESDVTEAGKSWLHAELYTFPEDGPPDGPCEPLRDDGAERLGFDRLDDLELREVFNCWENLPRPLKDAILLLCRSAEAIRGWRFRDSTCSSPEIL